MFGQQLVIWLLNALVTALTV